MSAASLTVVKGWPAILAALVIGGGVTAWWVLRTPEPAAPDPAAEIAAAPAPEATSPAAEPDAAPPAAELPEPVVAPLPEPPAFDVVRVATDGAALVAGQALAGGSVLVLVDEQEAARAVSDAGGQFVALFDLVHSDQPRVMSLELHLGDGRVVPSQQTVLLAASPAAPEVSEVPPLAEVPPADIPAEPPADAPETAPDVVASLPAAAPEADTSAEAAATPPALLVEADGSLRVMQRGSGAQPPEVMSNVVIEAISYTAEGEVLLAGRGAGGEGALQIYLDNRPVRSALLDETGDWQAELPEVDTGVYTLRVDQLDAEGRVTSRFETPFQREAPEVLASVAAPERGGRLEVVTVQPGNTLWGLSRAAYGEGVLYVHVFEANRDQIRNPDLIYPGQVFTMPELD